MPKLKLWLSAPLIHVPEGFTTTFTCEARYNWPNNQDPPATFPLDPINLHWFHENKPITLQVKIIIISSFVLDVYPKNTMSSSGISESKLIEFNVLHLKKN